jgi:uncharacterized repeat protein (TIGR01451 family)
MLKTSILPKSTRHLFLIVLSLFSFCWSIPAYSACNCPAPTDCPEQQVGPCSTPPSQYILRFSVAGEHGAMTFIGNTLGLSKAACMNEPGKNDSIGAFTTIDPTQMVGTYPSLAVGVGSPAGTTLNWQNNSSSAVLTIPPGSTILYAELVWSGSYGYYCSNPISGGVIGVDPNCVLDFADGPISFTTADNVVHAVIADPATKLQSQNPAADVANFYCGGNYTRSANVTALFAAPSLANPSGTYIVSGVPATVSSLDETHNAAGWTLAIVYRDPSNPNINNMTLFVGAQQASRMMEAPAEVSGFCAAPSETIGQTARLLASAIEEDANNTGDSMEFGPTPMTLTKLSGPNNPVNNFFASQINDDLGFLKNMTGTFCGLNQNPFSGMNINGGRQGYGITNVDCSATIVPNQTTAFARASTVGDDFMVNALGIQINVNAPVIVPVKKVNGQSSIASQIGDVVTFSHVIDNTGSGGASNVVFQDILETGLMFVPNTFKVNNVIVPGITNADLITGVSLGSIAMMQIVTVEFQAMIISPPLIGNVFHNFSTASFDFIACSETDPFHGSNDSNLVLITLPSNPPMPPPTDFNGIVKKCKLLNKTTQTLKATWVPSPLPNVVSYEISKNGKIEATVSPEGPFVFEICVHSKKEASEFTIVAVYPGNVKSLPLKITIAD